MSNDKGSHRPMPGQSPKPQQDWSQKGQQNKPQGGGHQPNMGGHQHGMPGARPPQGPGKK